MNLNNLLVTPLFQDLIIGPNYGFLWRHDVEATYRATLFGSSDWQIPAERPKLTLRFDPIYAYSTAQPSGSHSVTICPGDSVQLNRRWLHEPQYHKRPLDGNPTCGCQQQDSAAAPAPIRWPRPTAPSPTAPSFTIARAARTSTRCG
ncbi:MAG: hypothetical protein U0176_12940 [Bacteroidia bacterium]